MPKQGQFAKASRIKQLNNFKVKHHQQGQTITNDQLTDFLVVRYALTVKKRIPADSRETIQRFLIEISDQLITEKGNLAVMIPQLLHELTPRVPWQFFKQVDENWDKLQHFLQKELPAVPLQERLRVTATISSATVEETIAQLLTTKAAAITFIKQPQLAATMTEQTARMLLPTIYHDGEIDWQKVQALLAPFPFKVDPTLDKGSQEWLRALSALE